ncbi:MAG: hypothetical protein ACI9PP_001593, partial [Halobacteriales archaeon]
RGLGERLGIDRFDAAWIGVKLHGVNEKNMIRIEGLDNGRVVLGGGPALDDPQPVGLLGGQFTGDSHSRSIVAPHVRTHADHDDPIPMIEGD